MVTSGRKEVWWAYIKKLAVLCAYYFAIPTGLTWVVIIFGLSAEVIKPDQLTLYLGKYGLIVIAVFAILAGCETAYKLHQESMQRAARDFYSVNTNARIDRAHHVFYKRYNMGLTAQNGTPAIRQNWDQLVRQEMIEYCEPQCVEVYLCNTGRADPSGPISPISDAHFQAALDHVKSMLDNTLHIFIKRHEG